MICTVGGVMSGYWLIGSLEIASIPFNTMTIEITMAVTGLLINRSAIIPFPVWGLFTLGGRYIWLCRCRDDCHRRIIP